MAKTVSFTEKDVCALGLWSCDQVRCSFQTESNKRIVLNTAQVSEFWKSYETRYPSAFNGTMLGLIGIQSCETNRLILSVKRTSYAEYVATRDPTFQMTHPQVERANPIGITVLALSSDDMVVITRRSATAEQNAGMPYFVGGYAEPLTEDDLDGVICANALKELKEELSVANIAAIFVIGMAIDPFYCHPELFVVTKLRAQASSIHESWRGAQSRDEADDVLLLHVSELLSIPNEILFPAGVTWSFEAGVFFLRQCWSNVKPAINRV